MNKDVDAGMKMNVNTSTNSSSSGSEDGSEAALTGRHVLRVRYDECDSMGITYHARYLDWFVIGRTELLRSCGLPYAQLERSGLLLPVLDVHCRYLVSTRYDDWIGLETRLLDLTRTRMRFGYKVFRLPDAAGEEAAEEWTARGGTSRCGVPAAATTVGFSRHGILAAEGETSHAFIDAQHRPVDVKKRFPDVWRQLEPLAEALRHASEQRG